MNEIHLDPTTWRTSEDFYEAVLTALGAPGWHGRNMDALWDSLTSDDINARRQPICFVVRPEAPSAPEIIRCLEGLRRIVRDAVTERSARLDVVEGEAPVSKADGPP